MRSTDRDIRSKRPTAQLPRAAALALALLFGLAGCSGREASPPEPAPDVTSTPGDHCGELTTITTAKALRDYDILKGDDTTENNPITRWARDRLCVVQTNQWMVADQDQALGDRIRTALSNGEPLPDVLFLRSQDLPSILRDLIAADRIREMGSVFEEYASDRLKEAYELNPAVWKSVTLNGTRWGLPQISAADLGDPILWIRQDWLDALGLKPPATLDELENVMAAFAGRDPDGNGFDDTIGLAVAGQHTLNGWMGDVSFLFGAYGDQAHQWNRMADGTLAYGSVQPSVKSALRRLAEWYEAGYLASDFGTHDEQDAAALMTSGAAGIISGPGWMGGWPLGEATLEGAVFKPYPYPAGEDGRIGRIGTLPSYGSYLFRKDFDHFDKIFAYYDEVYGMLIEDPESDFAIGLAEGYDYTIVDGEPAYDFPGATSTIGNFFLVAPGSTPPKVIKGDSLERRVYDGKIDSYYEKKMAATASRTFLEGKLVVERQPGISYPEQFVGPQTPTMALKWRLLNKLEQTTFLQIAYGHAPLDDFDRFVKDWHENGGAQVTAEVNEWDRLSDIQS
ncbi:ABC transporter substrate-binding protein [Paenibacillaceae bacterium WGS1546]|uniref:ABC transporter substrate-binding protein n=1 Tax=Cohnella sp. WGS1546 TaxID=3366810 RepID=UPI00372D8433